MKIKGVIPARMAASRFPGKPMHMILGMPMLEHVYRRAKMFTNWHQLILATCDNEIEQFAKEKEFPVIKTGSHHTRALDRVTEAINNLNETTNDNDIVVCVQGDEPMMRPDMIDAVLSPLLESTSIPCTVLAMHIIDKSIWLNPDTVKIVHNSQGEVLYTSRAPIPYCRNEFSPSLMARRIYGIFAFRWKYLKAFSQHDEAPLEQIEACDSNRILDMSFSQYIAPYEHVESFSVDSPSDIGLVEKYMVNDKYWTLYK